MADSAMTPDPADVIAGWLWRGDMDGPMGESARSASGELLDALTAAGLQIVPIVDDATRQERPGLTPEWLTRMAIACRNVQEQAQPKNVEWFDWVPERLDRAAAYLGRTD